MILLWEIYWQGQFEMNESNQQTSGRAGSLNILASQRGLKTKAKLLKFFLPGESPCPELIGNTEFRFALRLPGMT